MLASVDWPEGLWTGDGLWLSKWIYRTQVLSDLRWGRRADADGQLVDTKAVRCNYDGRRVAGGGEPARCDGLARGAAGEARRRGAGAGAGAAACEAHRGGAGCFSRRGAGGRPDSARDAARTVPADGGSARGAGGPIRGAVDADARRVLSAHHLQQRGDRCAEHVAAGPAEHAADAARAGVRARADPRPSRLPCAGAGPRGRG